MNQKKAFFSCSSLLESGKESLAVLLGLPAPIKEQRPGLSTVHGSGGFSVAALVIGGVFLKRTS